MQPGIIDDLIKKYTSHIGHTIQYFNNGHTNNFGKLLRISPSNDSESVLLWLAADRFPSPIHYDQIQTCSCIKPKTA